MKKNLFLAFLLFVLVSCKKDTNSPVPGKTTHYVKRILLTAPLIHDDYYFTYNAKNKIIEIDQKGYRKIVIAYTGDLITKAVFTYYTGKPQGHIDFEYKSGLLTKEVRYYVEEDSYGNNLTYTQGFEYSYENNKIVQVKAYHTSGSLKATAMIDYDEQGNPVSITSSTGLRYNYEYSNSPYAIFTGNEKVYSCLWDLIPFTYILSFSSPAELNYHIPFKKEITSVMQTLPSGQRGMEMQYTYQKNSDGFINILTIKNLKDGNPFIYSFEYDER